VIVTTWPSKEELEKAKETTPSYMVPNNLPYAVIVEGYLSTEQCDLIVEEMSSIYPYSFEGCNALTRECPWPSPVLSEIELVARAINNLYWRYDLAEETRSWLQTYDHLADYHMHMDGSPGQTRKLTAVALLTNPTSYSGGELVLHSSPKEQVVPSTQGTVVIFRHWVLHEVTYLRSGLRQTINMGFWGPPFR
jgi:PKHD-type hydroxylase